MTFSYTVILLFEYTTSIENNDSEASITGIFLDSTGAISIDPIIERDSV